MTCRTPGHLGFGYAVEDLQNSSIPVSVQPIAASTQRHIAHKTDIEPDRPTAPEPIKDVENLSRQACLESLHQWVLSRAAGIFATWFGPATGDR